MSNPASIDVGQQGDHRAARVDERLPRRVLVDPIVHAAMERLIELAIGLGADERAVLRAEIGAGDEHRRHAVAHGVVNLRQVRQGDLALAAENLVDVVEAGDRAHVPLGDVADALGMLQPRGGHQGDVAEGRAAEIGQDRPIALLAQPVGLGGEVLQRRRRRSARTPPGCPRRSACSSSIGSWRTMVSK